MPNSWARTALVAAALSCASGLVQAGQLEVSPVTLELARGVSSTVLTVSNRGTERTAIQVRGFTWSQSARDDLVTPTRALLISPPIAELNPGETQTVRILLRDPARKVETSYRILVDEIPSVGAPSTVRLSLRLSLPLFAEPTEPTSPDLQWRLLNTPAGPELQATNHGTKRERVSELTVQATGVGSLKAQTLANTWVLPGAERHWRLSTHGELRTAQAHLTGKSDSGPINAALSVQRTP